jgi:thiol-disulfide isomerase/thioredoxin
MRNKLWVAPLLASVVAASGGTTAETDFERLRHATAWLNSPPLTEADLRGKVVLVDFWTYTCINWLRTLPYRRAWAEKYADQGFIVIGVHTPEFEFEKDAENVRRAVNALGIEYPVATDNDYAVWRAFQNNAWPALYFIDGTVTEQRLYQLVRQAAPIDERQFEIVFLDAVSRPTRSLSDNTL